MPASEEIIDLSKFAQLIVDRVVLQFKAEKEAKEIVKKNVIANLHEEKKENLNSMVVNIRSILPSDVTISFIQNLHKRCEIF